jgi:outer membrane protein
MKFYRKYLISQVILLMLANCLQAQEKTDSTLKFTLSEAQTYALQNNKSVLNANLDVESAKKKVWETTAIGLPQVSGKLAFSYTPELSAVVEEFSSLSNLGFWLYNVDQSLATLDPSNKVYGNIPPSSPTTINYDDYKWGLTGTITATQLIFSGSYLVGLQSAKVFKSISELSQVKSKQEIMETITESYFNLLIARENKQILDSTYNNLQKVFSDIQAMGKQGFIEETDVDQMHITVSTVKSSLDMITRLVSIAEKLLKLQLGIGFDKNIELTDSLNNLVTSLAYDQLLTADFVLEDNVNYKMLDASVKASELLLKLKKSEFLPDIAAYYQYQKEFNTNSISFTPPHVIGVQMNVPIFGSESKLAKVSQAKIDLMKAENNMVQASDGLKIEFFSAKSALITSVDKYQTESVNLRLSKKIYDKALIKYTNGVISGTDLNQIQNQYLQSQSTYYSSIKALIESKAKLEKMLSKAN